MVEVSLNLLWLSIAAASVVGWAMTRYRLPGKHRRQLSREIFGLAMAMALLWVPISLTDNLHSAILQAEDGGITKRIGKSCACAKLLSHHGTIPPPLAFFQINRPMFSLTPLYLLARHPSSLLPVTLMGPLFSTRAPPSL